MNVNRPKRDMKLYINGRFLTQQLTGVQVFAQEICKELDKSVDFEILVPKNQFIVNKSLNHKITKIGNLKGYFWEQISLPRFIKKQPYAILLNLCNLAPISLSNQVITIHDLAFIKNKNWFSFAFQKAYHFIIPKIVKNSKHIITVSETVKIELITTFELNPKKLSVIYNKLNQDLITSTPKKPQIPFETKEFYLMVGSNNPRKNFAFVEEIFLNELPNEKLVIVGANHTSFNTSKNTSEKNHLVRLKKTTHQELAWLYKNSKALINPSIYEGFGIPNIEAMYYHLPILCSNIPVFKEVCGSYAIYFELNNKIDFLKNLKKLDLNILVNTQNNVEFFQSQNRVLQLKQLLNL